MKVVTGPRASGKTTRAIKIANERNANLLVRSTQEARRIEHKVDNRVFTYHDLEQGKADGMVPKKIVIDEVDHYIQWLFTNQDVEAVTITPDELEILDNND